MALPFDGFAPLCSSDFAYGMKSTTGVYNANIASEQCDCRSTLHQDCSEQFMDSSKSPKGTSGKANQQVPSLRLAASAFAEMLATSCFPPNANESIKQSFTTEDPFLQLQLFLNDQASPQGISVEGPNFHIDSPGEQAGSSGSCVAPLFVDMFGNQQVALDAQSRDKHFEEKLSLSDCTSPNVGSDTVSNAGLGDISSCMFSMEKHISETTPSMYKEQVNISGLNLTAAGCEDHFDSSKNICLSQRENYEDSLREQCTSMSFNHPFHKLFKPEEPNNVHKAKHDGNFMLEERPWDAGFHAISFSDYDYPHVEKNLPDSFHEYLDCAFDPKSRRVPTNELNLLEDFPDQVSFVSPGKVDAICSGSCNMLIHSISNLSKVLHSHYVSSTRSTQSEENTKELQSAIWNLSRCLLHEHSASTQNFGNPLNLSQSPLQHADKVEAADVNAHLWGEKLGSHPEYFDYINLSGLNNVKVPFDSSSLDREDGPSTTLKIPDLNTDALVEGQTSQSGISKIVDLNLSLMGQDDVSKGAGEGNPSEQCINIAKAAVQVLQPEALEGSEMKQQSCSNATEISKSVPAKDTEVLPFKMHGSYFGSVGEKGEEEEILLVASERSPRSGGLPLSRSPDLNVVHAAVNEYPDADQVQMRMALIRASERSPRSVGLPLSGSPDLNVVHAAVNEYPDVDQVQMRMALIHASERSPRSVGLPLSGSPDVNVVHAVVNEYPDVDQVQMRMALIRARSVRDHMQEKLDPEDSFAGEAAAHGTISIKDNYIDGFCNEVESNLKNDKPEEEKNVVDPKGASASIAPDVEDTKLDNGCQVDLLPCLVDGQACTERIVYKAGQHSDPLSDEESSWEHIEDEQSSTPRAG